MYKMKMYKMKMKMYKILKKYLHLDFKKIILKFPRLASIRLGFYLAKKKDNFYYANLIVKILKKDLDIKEITTAQAMSELYSSTKGGPIYIYRKIKGFLSRSIIFSMLKKIHWITGILLLLNKNKHINLGLDNYKSNSDIVRSILTRMYLSDETSILNITEYVFFFCMIIVLLEILLKLWTIPDRRVSIFHANKKEGSISIYDKIPGNYKFYFHLGILMYSLFTRLQALGKITLGFLMVSQLGFIYPFVENWWIFELISTILSDFFDLLGFENGKMRCLNARYLKETTLKLIKSWVKYWWSK